MIRKDIPATQGDNNGEELNRDPPQGLFIIVFPLYAPTKAEIVCLFRCVY